MEKEIIEQYRERLFEKKALLEGAIKQLKKEFVGIDNVIDQIADAMNSWLYFPEMQEKPVVINLWGLTGIGKTSLVKRLAELIDFNENLAEEIGLGKIENDKDFLLLISS